MAPRPVPRAEFLTALGLEAIAHPGGLGAFIAADPTGLTEARVCERVLGDRRHGL